MIVTVVEGSSPLRLSGDVVGTSATQRPDSHPFCAASSALLVTMNSVRVPICAQSCWNFGVTAPEVRPKARVASVTVSPDHDVVAVYSAHLLLPLPNSAACVFAAVS